VIKVGTVLVCIIQQFQNWISLVFKEPAAIDRYVYEKWLIAMIKTH